MPYVQRLPRDKPADPNSVSFPHSYPTLFVSKVVQLTKLFYLLNLKNFSNFGWLIQNGYSRCCSFDRPFLKRLVYWNMSKFARSSKNWEKLEKSQVLLKLLNSSGKGGRRVPSKNCDFSKNCEKLEKSLKLIQTSVGGGTRVPSKNYDFSENCEQLEKSQFLLINYVKCYRR